MNTNTEVLRELDELEEAARLLGVTQAKRLFDCYTDEDRRFELAVRKSVAKHRAALCELLAGVEASYHPCTHILIDGLKRLEGGAAVLAEWDRARAQADAALAKFGGDDVTHPAPPSAVPEGYEKYDPPLLYEGKMFHEGQMRAYARANVARAVAPLRTEIERLREVLKEADDELDRLDEDMDTCDHSVGVCTCDYWNMRRKMKAARAQEGKT